MKRVIEAGYPIGFRKNEASLLGNLLNRHQSVVLIGMKRVGISNFLRFFLNHDGIDSTYIKNSDPQMFVKVDLNDLIERNLSAFWTLLLTRLVDCVQNSGISETDKRICRKLFVQSIQLKDHFFTLESVRKVLETLVHGGVSPTLFLIRFDRLQEVVTPEFFSNIVGLRDSLNKKFMYVITSHRPLTDLAPDVFKKQLVSVFSKDIYLPPATDEDMEIILNTLMEQHHTHVSAETKQSLIQLSGGYIQYLQLALMRLSEEKKIPDTLLKLQQLLLSDEQIAFQSEELFDNLTKKEKDVLLQIKSGNQISPSEREEVSYLWKTGMLQEAAGATRFFSPLFEEYIGKLSLASTVGKEFTKKEHLLFMYLSERVGELCERESIIEAVWPEHLEIGVSDWAIDRLVARLRGKLKNSHSPYQIITVVTRGYKLIRE